MCRAYLIVYIIWQNYTEQWNVYMNYCRTYNSYNPNTNKFIQEIVSSYVSWWKCFPPRKPHQKKKKEKKKKWKKRVKINLLQHNIKTLYIYIKSLVTKFIWRKFSSESTTQQMCFLKYIYIEKDVLWRRKYICNIVEYIFNKFKVVKSFTLYTRRCAQNY